MANEGSLSISGVDVQQGIAMTGGTVKLYLEVLSLFRKDAEDRLPLLQTVPEADALPAYITQVHALKSASASLGAAEISKEAARLEAAGKAGDAAFIQENLCGFTERLSELIKNIDTALEMNKAAGGQAGANDSADVLPLLRELVTALKSENDSDIDRILDILNEKSLDAKTREILDTISEQVLMSEFDKAIETIGVINDI